MGGLKDPYETIKTVYHSLWYWRSRRRNKISEQDLAVTLTRFGLDIKNTNFSVSFNTLKFWFTAMAPWNNSALMSLWAGQRIKLCTSSSTSFMLQQSQVLYSYDTLFCPYRITSTFSGAVPDLNCARALQWCRFRTL